MKLFTLIMVAAFSMAGCHSKKADTTTKTDNTTKTDTTTDTATKTDGTPCAQEIALQCPDGQIGGCLKTPAEGETHKCVAK